MLITYVTRSLIPVVKNNNNFGNEFYSQKVTLIDLKRLLLKK